jgi:hypothetical protein
MGFIDKLKNIIADEEDPSFNGHGNEILDEVKKRYDITIDRARKESGNIEQSSYNYVRDKFKFGLSWNVNSKSKKNKPNEYLFEDPTILGFELFFITDNSPLFNNGSTSINNFLNQYISIDTIKTRQTIYTEFLNIFKSIFAIEDNATKKQYYIEQIFGLEKLNSKITKYKEDKITIILTEDVSMLSLYLAELYNNLSYDYLNQRYAIPENCLRFDLIIKISDIRDFKLPVEKNSNSAEQYKSDNKFANGKSNIITAGTSGDNTDKKQNFLKSSTLNRNISSNVYILRDCNFDFSNSQNNLGNIEMAGYNTLDIKGISSLKFDIYYKSIERELTPYLIHNGLVLNNKKHDIIIKESENKSVDLIQNTKTDDFYFTNKFGSNYQKATPFTDDVLMNADEGGWWSDTKSKIKDRLHNTGKSLLKKAKDRAYLGKKLLKDITGNAFNALVAGKSYTDLYKINVDYQDQNSMKNFKNSLETAYLKRMAQNAATDAAGDLKNLAGGSLSDATGGIL